MNISAHRRGIGSFIVQFGWLIGGIAIISALVLYGISVPSLSFGLGSVDQMQGAKDNSLTFAWAVELLEVVGVCWIIAKELRIKEENAEDEALNAVINIVMIVILFGDGAAIFYASGVATGLPTDWFGWILGLFLRLMKAVIGAAGSETLILIGLYLILEWFDEYAHPHATPAPAHPAPAPRPAPPVLRPASSLNTGNTYRPAPKPAYNAPQSAVRPEPTYHPVGMQSVPRSGEVDGWHFNGQTWVED